jgi:hypothetical protein
MPGAAERPPPKHRPSVAFGCASAPAQRPAATRIATFTRSPAVASGRLDGLPRSRCTLLRYALPEDCQSRGCAPQMREAVGTTSRMARLTVAPLLMHPGARESLVQRSTRNRATAGVQSLRMCRLRFYPAWAHSQGGHPREARDGEACTGHDTGRRADRRWPKPTEDDTRPAPPQGGEPKRRRSERRTRRQAGGPGNLVPRNCLVRDGDRSP